MKLSFLQPRYWLALIIGVGSAILLTLLINDGELNARFAFESKPEVIVTTGTVKEGQILATILAQHNIPDPQIYKIQSTLGKVFNLRRLKPGKEYAVVTSTSHVFQKFIYNKDDKTSYTVERSSIAVYTCHKGTKKTVWIEKYVEIEVNENLYKDLLTAGYDLRFVDNLTTDLGDYIFAWRIDFFTEQRPGDKLKVLMEQEYKVGSDKPLWGGRGRILAASYYGSATREKENQAIRYQPALDKPADYFDLKGQAVRKAFLRAPFKHRGFRISSGFNLRRFHPIRRTYRPHHGIDYAAARGTRVASVGKGKIIYAGWKGNYGKTIEIRHSGKYVSRYGHLSKIAIRKGSYVEQGQYIGRVGSTGLSTGPHLHFEMIVDGKRRNFLRMNFPAAKSVAAKNMEEFKAVRDQYLSRLHRHEPLASSQI